MCIFFSSLANFISNKAFQKKQLIEQRFEDYIALLRDVTEKRFQISNSFENKMRDDNTTMNQEYDRDKIYVIRIFDKLIMEITIIIDDCNIAMNSSCKCCN
jgi:hypothetical protein